MRLFLIIQMSPKCNHKCPSKKEAGESERGDMMMEAEVGVTWGYKLGYSGIPWELKKARNRFSLEPPEHVQLC